MSSNHFYIYDCAICLSRMLSNAQDIRVAIECVTMLRTWCFKKSHTKLIFICFLHMLELVWRIVNKNNCSRENIFLRDGHICWFLYHFSSLRRFISNSPIVLHHAVRRTMCLSLNGSNDSVNEFGLNVKQFDLFGYWKNWRNLLLHLYGSCWRSFNSVLPVLNVLGEYFSLQGCYNTAFLIFLIGFHSRYSYKIICHKWQNKKVKGRNARNSYTLENTDLHKCYEFKKSFSCAYCFLS